ncbi:MAG: hypothetical protein HQK83_19775 [Fibrobacteria bacterium]|nr:hypothetical protein [Fibrobacteria bacterium]
MIFKLFITFFVLVLIQFQSCSQPTGPISSGTDVGNPEITACVSALMKITQDDSTWKMSSYLDNNLLDPSINDKPYLLAKTAATDSSDSCLVRVIDTMVVTDTAVIWDSTFVKELRIENRLHVDTTITQIDNYTITNIDSMYILDSVYILDTIIVGSKQITIDTLFQEKTIHDCSLAQIDFTDTSATETKRTILTDDAITFDSVIYFPANDSVAYIMDEPAAYNSSISMGEANITKNSNYNVYSVTKNLSGADGSSIFIKYADFDGDNLIYFAPEGIFPTIVLNGTLQKNKFKVTLQSTFNSGPDLNFSNIVDNIVTSFTRYDINNSDTLQTVSLVTDPDPTKDILYLEINKPSDNDSLVRLRAQYYFNTSLLSSLTKIKQDLHFSSALFQKIQLTASPDSVISETVTGRTFTFTAEVFKTDSSIMVFSGSANAQQGISGYFEIDGKHYTVIAPVNEQVFIQEEK